MSDNIIFTNNASALLAATISDTDLTVQVAAGYGTNFPDPSAAGKYFYMTLEDDDGTIEIIKITGKSSADLFTMDDVNDRGQDGTTAASHTLNTTRCELRITESVMEEFLQKNGGTMTGDVDFNGSNLKDAILTGSATRITNGKIVNVPLAGHATITTNQILIPTDGTARATAGGAPILVSGDQAGDYPIMDELDVGGIILFDSATVGVEIPALAYLRIEGTNSADYMQAVHDDTDFNFTFPNTAEVNWDTLLNMTAAIHMNENAIVQGLFSDYAVKTAAVNTSATTVLDYELGSYWQVTHDIDVTTLTVDNLPATGTAFLRLRLTHSAGSEAMNFTSLGASVYYPDGVPPTMSAGAGVVDVVDIWTEDGGTTWFVAGISSWSTP